jgi:ABC-type polar amino acid transport system ATPase subunit
MIQFNNVNKYYGKYHALIDVTETIARGEVVVVCGPSGSGKSTLIRTINRLEEIDSGQISVDGRDIHAAGVDVDKFRSGIGFVFQQFNLFPALTAVENVEYALNVKGVRGPEAREEAETLIAAVGLSDRRDFLPRDLSGGQKQRIAIARALCNSPAVLLADEPTANLDSQVGSQVLELFRGLARRENRALLIVTHDPRVRSVCDRVLRIADGKLLPESRLAA